MIEPNLVHFMVQTVLSTSSDNTLRDYDSERYTMFTNGTTIIKTW